MKAIVYTKYGSPDVLQLKDLEKPTPKDDEVLIKVYAASVNAYDWHFLTADIFLIRLMGGGLLKPKYMRLGAEVTAVCSPRNLDQARSIGADQKDLGLIKQLIEAGKVKPVIDRYYLLGEAAEALRYLGEGHARGKVVITVEQNNKI